MPPTRDQLGRLRNQRGSRIRYSRMTAESVVSVVMDMFVKRSALDVGGDAGLDGVEFLGARTIGVQQRAADHLGTLLLPHDLQALRNARGRIEDDRRAAGQ